MGPPPPSPPPPPRFSFQAVGTALQVYVAVILVDVIDWQWNPRYDKKCFGGLRLENLICHGGFTVDSRGFTVDLTVDLTVD